MVMADGFIVTMEACYSDEGIVMMMRPFGFGIGRTFNCARFSVIKKARETQSRELKIETDLFDLYLSYLSLRVKIDDSCSVGDRHGAAPV
jgi:hypothetical protein